MRVLVIDDSPERDAALRDYYAQHYAPGEAVEVEIVREFPDSFDGFDVVSLDFDLGPTTGLEGLKGMDPSEFVGLDFVLHSSNPVGAQQMRRYLEDWVPPGRIQVIPFPLIAEWC